MSCRDLINFKSDLIISESPVDGVSGPEDGATPDDASVVVVVVVEVVASEGGMSMLSLIFPYSDWIASISSLLSWRLGSQPL